MEKAKNLTVSGLIDAANAVTPGNDRNAKRRSVVVDVDGVQVPVAGVSANKDVVVLHLCPVEAEVEE